MWKIFGAGLMSQARRGEVVVMFTLRRPSNGFLHEFLARQKDARLLYGFLGQTRDASAAGHGWSIDRERVRLGHGETTFERARAALERWEMFPRQMATVWESATPAEGQNVLVVYYAAPVRLWMLFPARVIYVVEERDETVARYGFAYGTLEGHPERGEERFLVEWDRRDDSVWYDLTAISRPGHWLAWVGYPYTRYEQGRFRRLSGEAMRRAVGSAQ